MLIIKRLIAIIIDSIVVGIVNVIVGAVLGDATIAYIVTLIVGIVYQGYFLSMNNGQTPGKMLLGIRVVKMNGGSISFLEGGLRYIGYLINTLVFFLGWVLAVVTGRGIHDYLAGTQVVDA